MDGGSGVSRLFAFGLGFSALTLAERLAGKGWQIAGTARDVGKIGQLAARGYEIAQYSGRPATARSPMRFTARPISCIRSRRGLRAIRCSSITAR